MVGLLRLLALLPFRVIYALSIVLGELLFALVASRRHITLTNLRLCFPDKTEAERKSIAHRHFRLLACSLLAMGVFWWGSAARLKRLVKLEGLAYLENAQNQGQNIILLAPHFVALDAGGITLSIEHAMTSMYQANRNALFNRLSIDQRGRFNIEMFDRKASLTSLIRQIRSGKPFYYLPDQNAGTKHGLFAPLFNIQASTFHALGKIASAGKAVVIPCSNWILPWGKGIETKLYAPMEDFPTGDPLADTTTMNKVVEQLALEHIDDYLWSHKRFKCRPDGEDSFY